MHARQGALYANHAACVARRRGVEETRPQGLNGSAVIGRSLSRPRGGFWRASVSSRQRDDMAWPNMCADACRLDSHSEHRLSSHRRHPERTVGAERRSDSDRRDHSQDRPLRPFIYPSILVFFSLSFPNLVFTLILILTSILTSILTYPHESSRILTSILPVISR